MKTPPTAVGGIAAFLYKAAPNHFNGLQNAPLQSLPIATFRIGVNMDIKESDWKTFRRLRELALDRYCQRVLDEVRIIVEKSGDTNHKRYLALWKPQ